MALPAALSEWFTAQGWGLHPHQGAMLARIGARIDHIRLDWPSPLAEDAATHSRPNGFSDKGFLAKPDTRYRRPRAVNFSR